MKMGGHLGGNWLLVRTFCILTRLSPLSLEVNQPRDGNANVLDILQDYGSFTNELTINTMYTTQISHYATLLFVCLAVIARHTGVKPLDVDTQIVKFLKKQQGHGTDNLDHARRLRKAALWPIERMKELYKKGLKHRAWEIFVLCMISHYYHQELVLT
jgi:hypothetical protein